MPLNWAIFGIFLSSPPPLSPGLYCHTNISLGSSGTHVQRSLQCLSFCFINWLSPPFSTRKGSARNRFRGPFSNNLPRLRVSEPTPLKLLSHPNMKFYHHQHWPYPQSREKTYSMAHLATLSSSTCNSRGSACFENSSRLKYGFQRFPKSKQHLVNLKYRPLSVAAQCRYGEECWAEKRKKNLPAFARVELNLIAHHGTRAHPLYVDIQFWKPWAKRRIVKTGCIHVIQAVVAESHRPSSYVTNATYLKNTLRIQVWGCVLRFALCLRPKYDP
jgi:hypothetical protein